MVVTCNRYVYIGNALLGDSRIAAPSSYGCNVCARTFSNEADLHMHQKVFNHGSPPSADQGRDATLDLPSRLGKFTPEGTVGTCVLVIWYSAACGLPERVRCPLYALEKPKAIFLARRTFVYIFVFTDIQPLDRVRQKKPSRVQCFAIWDRALRRTRGRS